MTAKTETPDSVKAIGAAVFFVIPFFAFIATMMWLSREKTVPDANSAANWKVQTRELSDGVGYSFIGEVQPPLPMNGQIVKGEEIAEAFKFAGLKPVKGESLNEGEKTKRRWDRATWKWDYGPGKTLEVRCGRCRLSHTVEYIAIDEIRVVSNK